MELRYYRWQVRRISYSLMKDAVGVAVRRAGWLEGGRARARKADGGAAAGALGWHAAAEKGVVYA